MATITLIPRAPSVAVLASVVSRARMAWQALWSGLETLAEYRAASHLQDRAEGDSHNLPETLGRWAARQRYLGDNR
jgi:hypothetical protein